MSASILNRRNEGGNLPSLLSNSETFWRIYDKAMGSLDKDKIQIRDFYDFPAVHWQHVRTTRPIESTFASVPIKDKHNPKAVSRATISSMVFTLTQSAENKDSENRNVA